MIANVLAFTLQTVQYKALISSVISILNKTIICIKTMPNHQNKDEKDYQKDIQDIISLILDVLTAGSPQHKENQDTSLRILQTTFSLIDHTLLPYFDEKMIARMFSICFEFSKGASIVQNISTSALFAFVESLFKFGHVGRSLWVMTSFLEYLFDNKKFIWIKGEAKGLIWDLTVIGIKNLSANHIISLQHNEICLEKLNKMYDIVSSEILLKKNKDFYTLAPESPKQTKSKSDKQSENINNFVRYFKAFVSLSISLSLESEKIIQRELINFKSQIPKFIQVCDLERNSRMFIFLEAICQLLMTEYDLPLTTEKGITFLEILNKVSEELCLNNEGIKVNWETNENYLSKIVNEEPRITDGDFVRLIKNTIVSLRLKMEKDEDIIKCRLDKKVDKESSRSTIPTSPLLENKSISKKWESLIKNVIKIIRYLSSINFILPEEEEDPTRKIILELQYWFLLCPIPKSKNLILQELLITSNVLNNKMQAIKVSQSVQIGTNILYGYYEELDSVGLTIIFKMMAGVKADWEEGKSYEELDEIYNLCKGVFVEGGLGNDERLFVMTIQALVQCSNSLIADIEQPRELSTTVSPLLSPQIKRCHKMISYLIQKLLLLINQNPKLTIINWNFISAFFMTLCFNKNLKIKEESIKSIGILSKSILTVKIEEMGTTGNLMNNKSNEIQESTLTNNQIEIKKEQDIISLYVELSRAKVPEIELAMIEQLKSILPRFKEEVSIMDGFKIIKLLSNQENNKSIITSLNELQEILIKECLYKINSVQLLKTVLDTLQTTSADKNEEYRLINLLWSISDYFKKITSLHTHVSNNGIEDSATNTHTNIRETTITDPEYIELWENLFKNIFTICSKTQECETQQVAIHSMTQILAETTNILPFNFIIKIMENYYDQMVLILLGIHHLSLADSEKSPETAKVALKNYIKIFKKLITIDHFTIDHITAENKSELAQNISLINQKITNYIKKHIKEEDSSNLTLELIYELLNYISQLQCDDGFIEYHVGADILNMFNQIKMLIKMCEEKINAKMDLKSHMFRKKVQPLILKIEANEFVGSNQIKEAESKANLNEPPIETNQSEEAEGNQENSQELKEEENEKHEEKDKAVKNEESQ